MLHTPVNIRAKKSRTVRWAERVARVGKINAYKFVLHKPERKRPLGRHSYRWNENIKMEDADWIHLAHDRGMWRSLLNVTKSPQFRKRRSNF